MRPSNEEEWKKLQEIVKKIGEERNIGVDLSNVSFILSKDGIKKISGRRIFERIKHEKTNGMISPPSKPKKKRSLMKELKQVFLNIKLEEEWKKLQEIVTKIEPDLRNKIKESTNSEKEALKETKKMRRSLMEEYRRMFSDRKEE